MAVKKEKFINGIGFKICILPYKCLSEFEDVEVIHE